MDVKMCRHASASLGVSGVGLGGTNHASVNFLPEAPKARYEGTFVRRFFNRCACLYFHARRLRAREYHRALVHGCRASQARRGPIRVAETAAPQAHERRRVPSLLRQRRLHPVLARAVPCVSRKRRSAAGSGADRSARCALGRRLVEAEIGANRGGIGPEGPRRMIARARPLAKARHRCGRRDGVSRIIG